MPAAMLRGHRKMPPCQGESPGMRTIIRPIPDVAAPKKVWVSGEICIPSHLRRDRGGTRGRGSEFKRRVRPLVDQTSYLAGYLPILIFLGIALALSAVFVFAPIGASYLTGTHNPDPEKLSEYECGFPAFEDPRSQFDVRFYLVAILFIIFDLEAAFLFPWAVSLKQTQWIGWGTMMLFLFELIIGFIYAWKKGALDWE